MLPTMNENTGRNRICASDVVWKVLLKLDLAAYYQDSFAIMCAWSDEIKRVIWTKADNGSIFFKGDLLLQNLEKS